MTKKIPIKKKSANGDAKARTTRIEGSWFIASRNPTPVDPTMSK